MLVNGRIFSSDETFGSAVLSAKNEKRREAMNYASTKYEDKFDDFGYFSSTPVTGAVNNGNVTNIKAFLGTIAKRTAIDRFRSLSGKSNRTVYVDEDNMQELASDFNVESISDRNELRHILLSKIEELGEPDSTILIQKFYYNKTSSEIARKVSMTASSVRSRCTRAMEKLRVSLAEVGITQ